MGTNWRRNDDHSDRGGTAHRVLSVLLRLSQIACGAIVLGILAYFVDHVRSNSAHVDNRIIYSMVVATLTIVYSLVCLPPFNKLFYGFPMDWVLFILWIASFSLLETRSGVHACSANWYQNYWGYYWGRFWRFGPVGTVRLSGSGCGEWRAVLAFSFIAIIVYLLSGILGVYVFFNYLKKKGDTTRKTSKRHSGSTVSADVENQAPPMSTA